MLAEEQGQPTFRGSLSENQSHSVPPINPVVAYHKRIAAPIKCLGIIYGVGRTHLKVVQMAVTADIFKKNALLLGKLLRCLQANIQKNQ
jgi:hypothetical protein